MGERQADHVSERFKRLVDLYRKPDGSEWGGQDLERATGGLVSRSYVSNLRNGRIGSPGLNKLAAIAKEMGFPPRLWFLDEPAGNGGKLDEAEALVVALDDATVRQILEETLRMGVRRRHLLLGIAREIAQR